MFFKKAHYINEITAEELSGLLAEGKALVVDVREPNEFAAGHLPGALNQPLSTFNPSTLPAHAGKITVLQCAAGSRSGMALGKCAAARSQVDTHLAGGIAAWKAAGFPVVTGK